MSDEDPRIKLHRIPRWVLEEPVDVTLVLDNPVAEWSLYLVARVTGPGAITVHYSEDGIVVNGIRAEDEVGEAQMMLCEIKDSAIGELTEQHFDGWSSVWVLPFGKTVRINPEEGKS